MTIKSLVLNKQIMLALGMIVFIGAVVAASTGAFFSSQASATGNVFTAGSLDLMITSNDNGTVPEKTKVAEWNFDNMAPGGTPVEESVWLRNVGSIDGASVAFGADFSGQTNIAKQMRISTLEWDGTDLLAGSSMGAGADLSGYVAPTNCTVTLSGSDRLQAAINAATNGDVICASGTDYSTAWEGAPVIVNKEVTIVSTTGPNNHAISAGLQIDADNVTIRGFTLKSGSTILGEKAAVYLNTVGLENVSIEGNIIVGTVGTGFVTAERGVIISSGATFTNVSITNNEIHNLHSGIYANTHTGLIAVANNTFTENAVGIGGFTGLDAQFNRFTDNSVEAIGIDDSYDSTGAIITNNEFLNNDMVNDYGTVGGPDSVNAENNWWGDNNPSDQVSGDVDYTPFLTGPVASSSLDANGNGYFDMDDFRAADITGVMPGLIPYAGPNDDKEFKMAVQLDSSTGNTFQGLSLSNVTVQFTLNQN